MQKNTLIKQEIAYKNPEKIVSEIFSFPIFKKEREKEILVRRFGLEGKTKTTLDKIGKDLGITRERVRQIEKNAIQKILNNKDSKKILEEKGIDFSAFLNKNGLLCSEGEIASKILDSLETTTDQTNSVSFLLFLDKEIKYIKENKLHSGIWASKKIQGNLVTETLKKVIIGLEEEGKTLSIQEIKDKFNLTNDIKNLESILSASKLLLNVKNKWGLRSWRSINPKSIYDKILIILDETKTPLHYGEITIHLNNKYASKRITKKAVHNELIKNDKFVLIGRGIYALKEWGYERGTVADVIKEILEQAGKPLHKNEIVKRVLERRIVKEATIIINLQKFNRVGKAVYSV